MVINRFWQNNTSVAIQIIFAIEQSLNERDNKLQICHEIISLAILPNEIVSCHIWQYGVDQTKSYVTFVNARGGGRGFQLVPPPLPNNLEN